MNRGKRRNVATAVTPSPVVRQDGKQLLAADVEAPSIGTFENHSARHENGGADEISVAGLSGLLADAQTPLEHGNERHNPDFATEADVAALAVIVLEHSGRHENGGADEISVAGLSGELADPQPPKAHKTSHENGGADEISVAGLSGVLADPQTPADHAATHSDAGGDEIDVLDLAGYPGGTTDFLRADGSFAAPPSGGGWTTITNAATGATNNWAPAGLSGNTLIEWNGASDFSPTGLDGGVDGQIVLVKNMSSDKVIRCSHNSGSSDPDNIFWNLITSAPTPVAAGGFIAYQHNGSNWILIGHMQGLVITETFDAANFYGHTGVTWTVDSGDVAACSYLVEGRKITLFVNIQTSTIAVPGGGTGIEISNVAFGNFTFDLTSSAFTAGYLYDAGNTQAQTQPQANALRFNRFDGVAFTPATNLFWARAIVQVMLT